MRLLIALAAALASLCSLSASAQTITRYYDARWKECDPSSARFISLVEKEGSLWRQRDYYFPEKTLQMNGTYKENTSKTQHGTFTFYYDNKQVESTGMYVDGKKQGLWLRYHENSVMADSIVFENGQPVGTRLAWHSNGFLSDSAVMNADGSGVHVGWFDNGIPAFSGHFAAGEKKSGKWQFFYQNGGLSSLEVYENDRLVSRQYYEEGGMAIADTACTDREAEFTGGKREWARFLQRNLNPNVPIVNGASAGAYTILIRFVVDRDGTTSELKPLTRYGYGMEMEAMRIISGAPKWEPAVDHGRKIKAYRIQPITFVIAGR